MNCTVGNLTIFFADISDCRCSAGQECKPGLVVPEWHPPVDGLGKARKLGRAAVYFLALLYMFLGVSVVADRFMAAIETITSQERKISVKNKHGEKVTVTIRVWNETVSNLTLMALGSSAPEILLSIIEVCGNKFKAGDLGPNTIVGSAAFNLFVIIAICIFIIPNNEIRRQQHLRVFLVTATWSIFAYVWLYLILSVFSPGQVEIWEALLTFFFFPVTVFTAYVADRQFLGYKFLRKRYRGRSRSLFTPSMPENPQVQMGMAGDGPYGGTEPEMEALLETYQKNRRQFGSIFKKLKNDHPNLDLINLQREAEYEMIQNTKKSRAFYRIQTNKKMTGGGNVIRRNLHKIMSSKNLADRLDSKKIVEDTPGLRLFFNPPFYTVLENVGSLDLTLTLEGRVPDGWQLLVDYATVDGTANAGTDYVTSYGTVVFEPQPSLHNREKPIKMTPAEKLFQHVQIRVEILDDEIFEEDEHFYVRLDNPRLEKLRENTEGNIEKVLDGRYRIEITKPHCATVVILDDDHAGIFSIEKENYTVHENEGFLHVKIIRKTGSRGQVLVPYKTVSGTAQEVEDFEPKNSVLLFENEELEKTITIGIINDEEYEKSETFTIELGEPVWLEKTENGEQILEQYRNRERLESLGRTSFSLLDRLEPIEEPIVKGDDVEILGRPRLGNIKNCVVFIVESSDFKHLVDQVAEKTKMASVLGTSTWREQFTDALTVSTSSDECTVGGVSNYAEPSRPKIADYFMHFFSLPWKLLGACCPPTEYMNGWCCFLISVVLIGIFTAIIGDLANNFGCCIGLKDAVTAISFVAMGTSVPDLFASKLAAVQDKYADSSIGNVTGSNAVNVFLGIGIAWSLCAVVSYLRGEAHGFQVAPGSLAFTVTVFCTMAGVAICLLLARRRWRFFGGGELGGPFGSKTAAAGLLVTMWLIYLVLCSLEAYCIIPGF